MLRNELLNASYICHWQPISQRAEGMQGMHDVPTHAILAQVERPGHSKCPTALPSRRLRQCADLHVSLDGATISSVTSIPSVLNGVQYVPTQDEHAAVSTSNREVHVRAMQPTKICILWPALQEPPPWLREGFDLIRGAEVQVSVTLMI